jgi:hypothetical protein
MDQDSKGEAEGDSSTHEIVDEEARFVKQSLGEALFYNLLAILNFWPQFGHEKYFM